MQHRLLLENRDHVAGLGVFGAAHLDTAGCNLQGTRYLG
jgi:hypothetical protein